MKRVLVMILLLGTGIVSQDVLAQALNEKIVISKATNVVNTRGSKPIFGFLKHKGQRKYLKCPVFGKKRGVTPKCNIRIENEVDRSVDVYVDGTYQGSVKGKDKGVVENLKKYSEVICLSEDGKLSWKEKGDCSITLVMKLTL